MRFSADSADNCTKSAYYELSAYLRHAVLAFNPGQGDTLGKCALGEKEENQDRQHGQSGGDYKPSEIARLQMPLARIEKL